jgi:RNA polymerase sigma factor (sigma-70 family)
MTLFARDRRLLVAFRAGDREALELTYNHYVRPLASFLQAGFGFRSKGEQRFFRGIRSAFELDNALQEVFARAFAPQARTNYDGIRPYLNYLCAIAKNYVIDEARRGGNRFTAIDLDDVDPETAVRLAEDQPAKGPNAAAEGRELQGLLEAFVRSRDERERTLYAIRYGEHATQNEAAQRMNLTRVQVRRIEAKMLADLLLHLRAHGYLTEHEVSLPVLVRGAGCWIVISSAVAWEIWRNAA